MTRKEARELCNEIKLYGLHCTIPRGKTRPRIFVSDQMTERFFSSRGEWLTYKAAREAKIRAAVRSL